MNAVTITPDQVLKASAATGNSPKWLLVSVNKDAYIVKDRVAVSLVMRNALGMSWPAIGKLLNRNHASVMRAFEKYKNDKDVKEAYIKVCAALDLGASCAQGGGES